MKKLHCAFTFVELIVVITIMAILATIGFSVYQSYLESSRDTNRVVQLSEISDGFEKLSLSARLPFPESMVEIQVGSGTVKTFAYQGFAGEKVMQAIGYVGGGQDPESSLYPTYMLSESRKDFQLMTFIKDAKLLSSKNVYANTQFEKLFPKVVGSPLGILLEQGTQIPLHMLPNIESTGVYNITTGTGNLKSILADKTDIISSSGALLSMIPNQSCKRILELGKSQGNGIYTISPDGVKKIQVYCDMTTDGGGWTMVARSVKGVLPDTSFGWFIQRGSVNNDAVPYSLGVDVKDIIFNEFLTAVYSQGKQMDFPARKMLIDRQSLIGNTTISELYLPGCVANNIITCRVGNSYWGNVIKTDRYFFGKQDFFHYGLGYQTIASEGSDSFNGKPGILFIR